MIVLYIGDVRFIEERCEKLETYVMTSDSDVIDCSPYIGVSSGDVKTDDEISACDKT